MSISSRAERTARLCRLALLVAVAMMLSYLEYLLPLGALIPLPGFRLGLANVVVLLAFSLLSPTEAALISGVRILLMGLLFGTATSLYFSVMGGLFSFLALLVCAKFCKRCSFFGVSVLSAAAHNCGQITAAVTLFGSSVLLSYLPWLLIASVIYGGIVGVLLNLCASKLQVFLQRRGI